jgi:hypothetical protein
MKRLLRPAFVVTAIVSTIGCESGGPRNPPPVTPEEKTAFRAKHGIHPRDADLHMIFIRGAGDCYVQVDKDEPPPKDMMSGEKWVEDKSVPCPPEFDEPEFAAIGDQQYWILDRSNECSVGQAYGNPPPAPVDRPCPPSIRKTLPPGAGLKTAEPPPAPEPPTP